MTVAIRRCHVGEYRSGVAHMNRYMCHRQPIMATSSQQNKRINKRKALVSGVASSVIKRIM